MGQFCEPEIQYFCVPVFGQKNIFRLEVAMDDAFVVGGGKRIGELRGEFHKLTSRNGIRAQSLTQTFAFQEFRNEKGHALVLTYEVDGENVGVLQSRCGLSLLAETAQAVGILQIAGMENFYGDVASESGVARSIDLPHSAGTQQGENFVRAQF